MEYIILETKVLNTQNWSLPNWGLKESDTTEQLNRTELNYFIAFIIFDASEVIDDLYLDGGNTLEWCAMAPLFPVLHLVTSLCSPEISHSRRIYTTEMGKPCKLGLPPISSRLLNFHQDTTAYKVRHFPNIKVDLDIG